MRLLTHNMLMCNKKGVLNGFPLKIQASKLVYEETEFNAVFVAHMVQKLEYPALLQALADIKKCPVFVREDGGPELCGGVDGDGKPLKEDAVKEDVAMEDGSSAGSAAAASAPEAAVPVLPELPAELPSQWERDEAFLRKMHLVLHDVLVDEGTLVCPESGREFPVERGIPNMLLHDDEI